MNEIARRSVFGGPSIVFAAPTLKALGIVILTNILFFVLVLVTPGDPDVMLNRIRTAFETGELGLTDYLWFDSRHGWHQYNGCNILQMLSNRDPSRLGRALAPLVHRADENGNGQCVVLYALVPAVWTLLLPRHTYIHAAFMVRMLVVPISLAPLAWCWPAAQETSIPPGVFSD